MSNPSSLLANKNQLPYFHGKIISQIAIFGILIFFSVCIVLFFVQYHAILYHYSSLYKRKRKDESDADKFISALQPKIKRTDGIPCSVRGCPHTALAEASAAPAEESDAETLTCTYGAFTSALFEKNVNFSEALLELVLADENRFLLSAARKEVCPPAICDAAKRELDFFTELAGLSAKAIKTILPEEIAAFLPDWETTALDFYAAYTKHIADAPKKGYGIFAKYHAFSFGDNGLQPVKHPDPQSLSQLSGYEREVGIVMRNTEALLAGIPASNLLLYGDAGAGKSSTIKAVANALQEEGLRLIEVKKNQLFRLPSLLEQLAENPLKFIIFIDDLSFAGNDEHFAALKATLEGSVTACAKNTVIYATSNRRHLVKETMEERSGDDIHLNDTLQELMSLSARFGMTITFQKPDKDGYLAIVKHLAKEYNLKMPEEELCTKAEGFAIRQNGRSPRTAKHFVETQLAKL